MGNYKQETAAVLNCPVHRTIIRTCIEALHDPGYFELQKVIDAHALGNVRGIRWQRIFNVLGNLVKEREPDLLFNALGATVFDKRMRAPVFKQSGNIGRPAPVGGGAAARGGAVMRLEKPSFDLFIQPLSENAMQDIIDAFEQGAGGYEKRVAS